MILEKKLAEERRARLAAERLLEQKSRELFDANRKLSVHARHLSDEIVETKQQAEALRGMNNQVQAELEVVTHAVAIAERRLWDSLETIRDGFAVFDSDGRMAAANRAYLSIFDGLEDVTLGVRYDDVARLIAEEGIVDTEGESLSSWIEGMRARWQLDPIPDRVIRLWNGQYVKLIDRRTPGGDIVSLNLNITEMMRMWAAVEAIPDGFVLYDREDRMVMCNEHYREIYSQSAPAMKPGATFEEILRYGLDRGQYVDAIGREEDWLSERLTRHQKANGVIEQELGDGRWLRILEQRTPDGGLVGLRVDITEQKRQQQALEEARIAAEAANRAKSAFLANMSHELRTPMNGVVGMADLLCDTTLSDEQRLYAETIRNSGEALLTLLNDVLDYSKIEAEKLRLHPEPFDLERAIHEVVMLLQATAQDKSLELFIDYDMFQPTRFTGDRGRIRQILTNLVGNAVKFTEHGHVLVRVVGLESDQPGHQQIHITVEDTGIGIAQEMQAHIFGEFNQVEDQQNRKFEGTGLGLAISRQLVELMGGEIWLESEKGKGACFGIRLTLPIAEDSDEGPVTLTPKLKRVLVVDDQEINRTVLDRQLGQMGLEVILHRSAELALSAWDEIGPVGLVITDQNMPGLNGDEFAQALRARGCSVPILVLSSNPATMRNAAAQEAVDLVMSKPVLRRGLYEAINGLIDAQPEKAPPTQLPPPAPTTNRKMRILAAEDNKTNRLVFSKMVKSLEIDLTFANNGLLAVEAFRAQRPDLIFMDISMPEMDGKDATRAIRALEAKAGTAPVPIVALTAHALEGDAEEILAAGLDHYLTKPLRKDAIVKLVRDLCPAGCVPPVAETPPQPVEAGALHGS
ncbi:hybrid sensor histidine kinase/response regulator [Actibacterium lipolyticum]|uniref:Sensory/regulatory protein RpfC n=1 Tax=Actibacterium lipolyticum TaxID=1524263 RepID=A0A238KWT6_9RHOB|nr:response regulator [Actibacterium lipolyticum]SMX46672.1 Signal transduction histidine-protein kinase BarA [Actibacterium lipolyticum]